MKVTAGAETFPYTGIEDMGMSQCVRRGRVWGLMLLLSATFAWGQASPPKTRKLGQLEVTGSLRLRAESWDWFDSSAADGTYGFGASLLRLGIGQKHSKFDWQVEIAQPLLLGLPQDAIAPPPQGQLGLGATYFATNGSPYPALVFLKQGFVRFKGLGGDANSLRLGRFEFVEGAETAPKDPTLAALKKDRIAHRLIGNFGFSHVGRSFDALQFVRETPGSNLTVMAGRATQGVFDVNGMPELDVDVLYGAYTRPIKRLGAGEWRVFAMHYHDGRGALKTDNRPLPVRAGDQENIRIGTVGGHLLQTFQAGSGTADLLFWGAVQTGRWGLLGQRAGAVAVEAGYQPNLPKLKPWVRAGYFRSSGDGNPSDGQHSTFFQALPTPRIYARFPFYNLMNNEDEFVQLLLRPHKRLLLRSDAHALRLSEAADLWYQGGGAYEQNTFGFSGRPSGGNRSLASVFDLSADVQVSSQVSLGFYFANASGKRVISKIYPEGRNGRFGYLEFLWRF